jgi:hypothetical protein
MQEYHYGGVKMRRMGGCKDQRLAHAHAARTSIAVVPDPNRGDWIDLCYRFPIGWCGVPSDSSPRLLDHPVGGDERGLFGRGKQCTGTSSTRRRDKYGRVHNDGGGWTLHPCFMSWRTAAMDQSTGSTLPKEARAASSAGSALGRGRRLSAAPEGRPCGCRILRGSDPVRRRSRPRRSSEGRGC